MPSPPFSTFVERDLEKSFVIWARLERVVLSGSWAVVQRRIAESDELAERAIALEQLWFLPSF